MIHITLHFFYSEKHFVSLFTKKWQISISHVYVPLACLQSLRTTWSDNNMNVEHYEGKDCKV